MMSEELERDNQALRDRLQEMHIALMFAVQMADSLHEQVFGEVSKTEAMQEIRKLVGA